MLKENIFLERELESARIQCALKPDFNLLDCFKIFDSKGAGNVSVQDVIMTLKDTINVHDFSHDDVYLLFRRHDFNHDGKLNFHEFSNIMLPLSKEYAALLTDRPDFYMSRGVPISQFFNFETKSEMRQLWQTIFKVERNCEALRMNLRQRPYFNLKQAFAFLDSDMDGFIMVEDVREFLATNGFFATERELQCVFHKCDRNNNGRVTFAEFVEEFQPKLC